MDFSFNFLLRSKKASWFFYVVLFISLPAFGQGRWVNHISQAALPGMDVRDVLVGSKGHKWFATSEGLAKFNGTDWITFRAKYPFEQLRHNDVKALAEGLDGKIWIVTAEGVNTFNGEEWDFYDANHGLLSNEHYRVVKADGKGIVWLGHKDGITRFDGNNFINITQVNGQKLSNVNYIEIDQNGDAWFSYFEEGTNKSGILKYENGDLTGYTCQEVGGECYGKPVLSSAANKIWVGDEQGSDLLYYEENKWHPFKVLSNMGYAHARGKVIGDEMGSLWFLPGLNDGSVFKYVSHNNSWHKYTFDGQSPIITGASDGKHIWFGSSRIGVFKVNMTTGTWQNINALYGLSSSNITKIVVDKPGIPLVVGSPNSWEGSVIDKFDGADWAQLKAPHNVGDVIDIFKDSRGKVWVVSSSGAHTLENESWTTYTSSNSLLPERLVNAAAAADLAGNIYVSFQEQTSWQGRLIMYDGNRWSDITSKHSALKGYILAIKVTSDGKVWFSTNDGVIVKDGDRWVGNEAFNNQPVGIEDNDGGVWFASGNSRVSRFFDGVTKEYNLSQLLGGPDSTDIRYTIRGLAVDYKGHIWAGGHVSDSFGSRVENFPGLLRFDGTSWTAYSKENGLVSDAVNTIQADALGNIWVGTQKGLSQLILFSETVTLTTSNISCHGGNDGAIVLTPEGNKPPYQYSIDGGETFVSESEFRGLAAGSYHIIAKDGEGHVAHDEIVVLTQPEGVFTWKVSPVSCSGAGDGAVALTVQAGSSPVSFEWFNAKGSSIATTKDVTSLVGGVYRVVARYGTCTVAREIEVPEPKPLQATPEFSNSCGDDASGQIIIRATGGTAPYKYSIDGGTLFQSQGTFSGLGIGSYQIAVQDAKGCLFTGETVVIEQRDKPVPVVVVTGNLALCAGNSVILKTAQVYNAYEWYNSKGELLSTASQLEVTHAGDFYVVVSQDKCKAVSNTITTTSVGTYNQQQVCIVTVDAGTGKNKVTWSKVEGQHIAAYNIYKETGANRYSLIGTVPFHSANFYIDADSDPMKTSERYSIAIVDICGRESAKSMAHKTIYLQASLGVNNGINLSWSNYEGFNYDQVNILRGASVSTLQLLTTRPANNNTFTDTNPNPAETVYVVEAVAGYFCEESHGNSRLSLGGVETVQHAFTRSNSGTTTKPLAAKEDINTSSTLKVYPNPAKSFMEVELVEGKAIRSVSILDISGRVVQRTDVSGSEFAVTITCKTKAGLYLLQVIDSQGQVYHRRIMVE